MLSAPDREDDRASPQGPSSQGPSRLEALARRWVLPAAIVLLAVPFVVAVAAQRQPQWVPVLDLAMTEVRVRDVFTRDVPLVGLPGRIGDFPDQGSHPGPVSFYALAPAYHLLGASSWALQAATAAVNLGACALALWIGLRRGGPRMVAAVFLLLAVALRGYGMESLIEPWNPLMPLLWFVVLALATWAVLCRDVAMLPVAVFSASFCAQTHVPYLLLSLALGALCVVGVALAVRDAPPRPSGVGSAGEPDPTRASPARTSAQRRTILRWVALAAAIGAVLWLPPVIDQLVTGGGNLGMLVEHFAADPPEAKLGFVTGVEWLLVNLDPVAIFTAGGLVGGPFVVAALDPTRSALPGALLVVVWAGAVVIAWRRGHRPLLWLHLVVATGLVVGTFSLANVFGRQWYYLTLWSWTLVLLMVGSVAWTALLLVRDRLAAPSAARLAERVGVVTFVVAALVTGVAAVGSIDDEAPDPVLSEVLREVIPPTAVALEEGVGAAEGTDGRYLVAWDDAYHIGSQSYAVVSELERLGFDVGLVETFRVPMTEHRVVHPDEATAEVRLVLGTDQIAEVAAIEGAVEVAHHDPRSPADAAEAERLREELEEGLRALGLDELVALIDENLFAVTIDPRLPIDLERTGFRILQLGQPTSVFVLPVGAG